MIGNPGQTNYSASKAGLHGLTRSVARELAGRNVTVNAIAPGIFVTDLNRKLLEGTSRGGELRMRTPMDRFGQVEEVADGSGGEVQ